LELSPSIFPLGDSAITIDLGNHIDEQLNRKALAIHNALQALRLPGIRDIIAAYSSVSVFYDPERVMAEDHVCPDGAFACMKKRLEEAWGAVTASYNDSGSLSGSVNIIRLPVCYDAEYGPDQDQLRPCAVEELRIGFGEPAITELLLQPLRQRGPLILGQPHSWWRWRVRVLHRDDVARLSLDAQAPS